MDRTAKNEIPALSTMSRSFRTCRTTRRTTRRHPRAGMPRGEAALLSPPWPSAMGGPVPTAGPEHAGTSAFVATQVIHDQLGNDSGVPARRPVGEVEDGDH